jgi:hypothetical protein
MFAKPIPVYQGFSEETASEVRGAEAGSASTPPPATISCRRRNCAAIAPIRQSLTRGGVGMSSASRRAQRAKASRAALDQLRAEGLVIGRQGSGRSSGSRSFPGVSAPASPLVAEWRGIDPGTVVTVRERVLGTEGQPPVMLATFHFPGFVTDKAPALADPTRGGMPELLRGAFGDTYSTDVLMVRMPTATEAQRLDLPRGVPSR